ETVFRLYDTYGFPVDLTADICRERGVRIDMAGFEAAMDEQRERARRASKFSAAASLEYQGGKTEFHGYETLSLPAKVVALYREGTQVPALRSGESGTAVLDRTPFYAESGGQVGDRGELVGSGGTFAVDDTGKVQADVFGHDGRLKTGTLKVGDKVEARVDTALRASTMRNHSVTHLMHKALREVLGTHVQQKGSLVDPDKTRFDFSHDKPVSEQQVREVEQRVNAEILQNSPTRAQVMPIEQAKKSGAMMLFGEKYGDEVRVLEIGSSREFCGGTHVARTGDIGLVSVVSEGAVAAGVRRLEAMTGDAARRHLKGQSRRLQDIAGLLKIPVDEAPERLAVVLDERRKLERDLTDARRKLAMGGGASEADEIKNIRGVKYLARVLRDVPAKDLKPLVDEAKKRVGSGVVAFVTVGEDQRASIIVGVTEDQMEANNAVQLVRTGAEVLGGKGGGGRPDMAQAGGPNGAQAEAALKAVEAGIAARSPEAA
ncbi:MAG TPA: alanine--tRNA ligase-related protein, partial [Steroidobacteraceae bacterium]|nr:alanine--tRNA ligase-related protein [Steroidobacteraceae bacterium]